MKLRQVYEIGMKVIQALTPACVRISIAGSVRRGKPEPKDLEIVYIPRVSDERINLFDYASIPATDHVISTLMRTRYWYLDNEVKRNGPRHKRLIVPETSIWHPGGAPLVVELYRADEDNWGYIYALRTGPGPFNAIWARKEWHGGCCPINVTLQDGYVWRDGHQVPVPEERDFFEVLGLPCWPPEERTAARLGKWMIEQKLVVQ